MKMASALKKLLLLHMIPLTLSFSSPKSSFSVSSMSTKTQPRESLSAVPNIKQPKTKKRTRKSSDSLTDTELKAVERLSRGIANKIQTGRRSIPGVFDGGNTNDVAKRGNAKSRNKNRSVVTPGSRKNSYRTKYDSAKVGNLVVPTVGIGTISWSSKSLTELENLELQILVKEAYEREVTFFDTAERYGSNFKTAFGLGWGETESLLNKYVTKAMDSDNYTVGVKEKSPVIATKFTPSPWRTTVESVVEACENSRRRLGVEQIDLYQMNMPDIVQPLRPFGIGSCKDEVYWRGLAECYHRGLVKNVGVSNYGPTLLMKCQDTLSKLGVPLASNQIAYSLIGRQNGAQETVDKCLELGVKPLACYPFAMGLLTGKYSEKRLQYSATDATLAPLTNSKKSPLEIKDLMKYSNGSKNAGGIDPLLQEMEMIAMEREKTIAQVALNYVICKGAIPIPGARSIAQVRDNIGAMGWRLTPREVGKLEEAADKLGFAFEGAGFKRVSEKFVGYGVEKWRLD